jgi:hypothetical protein
MRRCILLVLLLAAGVIVAGKSRAATSEDVAALVQAALDKLLGGRDSYEAYLYPPSATDPLGTYPKLDLSATETRFLNVPVASLDLSVKAVQLDLSYLKKKELRFLRGRVQNLELVISEKDLLSILVAQKFAKKIKNLDVEFTNGLVRLTGRVPVGFLTPEAQLTGTLEVGAGGREVNFVPADLKVAGISTGNGTLSKLTHSVNPLLDLEKLAQDYNLDVRIRSIDIRPGSLRIRG